MTDKIKIISVASLLAEAIKRIYEGLSLSKLFD
jgi:phosphoribosylpyrophosphate synthetase